MSKTPTWFIGALERGFAVIKAFDSSTPTLKITEVAQRTGMSRFAVRRFLKTLEALGYVGLDDDRYFLKPRVLELGYSYLASSQFGSLVQPYLASLVEKAGGSASFAVMDGDDVVYLARAAAPNVYNLTVRLHTRQPAYTFSAGRALLAHFAPERLDQYLSDVSLTRFTDRTITSQKKLRRQLALERKQGWSGVQDEMTYGVMAIAAPIRNRDGQVIAAVNLNPHGALQTLDELVTLHLDTLKKTAVAIERELLANLPHFGQ